MAGINKVILVGNLGAKPELKYGASGNAIANLSVATSESWTDKNTGQKQERTEWHRVSMFGKLAEVAAQYTDKGSKVLVQGKLVQDSWKDKEGNALSDEEILDIGFLMFMAGLDTVTSLFGFSFTTFLSFFLGGLTLYVGSSFISFISIWIRVISRRFRSGYSY